MPRLLLLVFGLLATALLLSAVHAAPTSTAGKQPHTIPLSILRLPEGANKHWTSSLVHLFQEKTTGGNAGLIFNISNWQLIGTVSVGTPAQSVNVWVSPYYSDFLFLDAYGPDSGSSDTTVAKAGRYDYTASTTAIATNNQPFFGVYSEANGTTTVMDTVQFNSVSLTNLTFGDSTAYDSWVTQLGLAGIIGLSPNLNTGDTNLTSITSNFGTQLAANSAVDTPVASISFSISAVNFNTGASTSSGQVTVGAEDGSACTAGSYSYVTNTGPYSTSFRVDSISGASPSGDSLSLAINVNRSVVIWPMFVGFVGSSDFVQLLVNASGLKLVDAANGYYEANSCDDVQNMGSLTLNIAGGSTLTIAPADYISQNVTSDGTTKCGAYFNSLGFPETDSSAKHQGFTWPIVLSQTWLNNHCYAHNYVDGTIGVGGTTTQTTLVVSS